MSRHPIYTVLFFLILVGIIVFNLSSAVALFLGVALSLSIQNPFLPKLKALTPKLLSASVMALGAGMNLAVVFRVGLDGIGYTVLGISFTMFLGILLGNFLKIQKPIVLLVSVGTAICGGSAIAAIAPIIRAKSEDVTISLATVFCLNALALIIFPWIGHSLNLSQIQFGYWSALAVHDTSSVVGTASQYGLESLQIATTVKLARALWIFPVALIMSYFTNKNVDISKVSIKKPWFILGFIATAALATWVPALHRAALICASLGKRALIITLFFIGCSLTKKTLKSVGLKPLFHGAILWVTVSSASLILILRLMKLSK